MENFDYKKYLKNNPLLKEMENPFDKLEGTTDADKITGGERDPATGELRKEGHKEGHEGGIPDSDVEHDDHEHEWEDRGDEEGTFTGEEECKICGLRRSVYDEDKKFKDYEGPSIEDIASEPENIENWLTKEDLPLKGKETVDSYIKKWNDKMKGSSRSTAKDWVDGIKGISKEDKESILKGIKGKITKSQLKEMIREIISEDVGRTDAKTILSSVDIDAKDISNDPRFKDSIKTGEAIYSTSVPEQQVKKKLEDKGGEYYDNISVDTLEGETIIFFRGKKGLK